VGAELEDGEVGGNYEPMDPREEERRARMRNEGLWRDEDAELYNEGELSFRFRVITHDVSEDPWRDPCGGADH
jgi:hypothetical protein